MTHTDCLVCLDRPWLLKDFDNLKFGLFLFKTKPLNVSVFCESWMESWSGAAWSSSPGVLGGWGPGHHCHVQSVMAVCCHSDSPGSALACLPCGQVLERFMNATLLFLMVVLLRGQPGPADPGNPELPYLCCYTKICAAIPRSFRCMATDPLLCM